MKKMYEYFIGIDPGIKGGLALIDSNKQLLYRTPFGEERYISALQNFQKYNNVLAVVEDVHAMPNQGVVSMFNFGKNLGFILGALKSFGYDIKMVSPNKWKRAFKLGNDKKLSIELVKHLYPQVSLLATPRSRVAHDGIAEAILLAFYGWGLEYGNL